MAGKLKLSRYKDDLGNVYPIRVSPATELLAFGTQQNAPTVDPITEKSLLVIRRDASEFGLKTRKIAVRWVNDVPVGYVNTTTLYIPILTKLIFDAITIGQIATYRGEPVQVVSLISERK